jgi:Fe-S cluster biosynthesis and repair protein YggX
MDSKELTVIVLLDFSKAFDSIDHCKLLVKLQALGLSLSALEWFRSYLTDRKQQVRIGSVLSELGNITHGVPQGSILGPALFNIYLNDLPTMPNSGALESFVDDSKLYLSFPVKNAGEVMRKINEDLSKIAAWCCYNSLLINPGKTKMLVIGIRKMLHKLPENFHVTLLGKRITPAISVRDLGIQLDSLLSFDEHIDVTTSTCVGSLCQINRVKHLFDSETLENVISSLVFSKLYYGSTVWSNTTQKNIKKLQKVQNFAARIITCTRKYEHITPVIRQLGWLPVADMLKYYLGILTFKCLNGLAPDYLSTLFKDRSSVHDKNTRNNEKLNIPVFSSAVGQRSFEYRAVSLWNSLPADITACDNLNVFKRKFYKFLLENF